MERSKSPFPPALGSWHRSFSPVPRVSSIGPFLNLRVAVSQLTSDVFNLLYLYRAVELLLGVTAHPDTVWGSSPSCIGVGGMRLASHSWEDNLCLSVCRSRCSVISKSPPGRSRVRTSHFLLAGRGEINFEHIESPRYWDLICCHS